MSSARGCCEPSWSKTIHGRCVFPFPDPSSWVLFPSPFLGKERLQAASFLPHPWLSSRDVSQGECARSPEVTEQLSRGLAKLLAFGVEFCLSFLFFLVAHWPHAPSRQRCLLSSSSRRGCLAGCSIRNGVCPATPLPCESFSCWQLPDPGISRARGFFRIAVCRSPSPAAVLGWGPCPPHLGPAIKDFL